MNKLLQKYSLIIVSTMILIYSFVSNLKMEITGDFMEKFYVSLVVLLSCVVLITFVLEKLLSKYIDIFRYTRFIASLGFIVLLIFTITTLYDSFNSIYSYMNVIVDMTLGFLLIILVLMSVSYENLYYKGTEINSTEYLKELGIHSLLTVTLLTVLVVEIIAVLILGVLGVRV